VADATIAATPAATILLLRDRADLEVLMVERHKDIKFGGGASVFPGGRIESSDNDPAWSDYVVDFQKFPEQERAPRIAAIREAFEETGILLAYRKDDRCLLSDKEADTFDRHRKAVEENDQLFLPLIRDQDWKLACDRLQLFARWEPPANVKFRRYATWFFAAQAPLKQKPRADGKEATLAFWAAPKDILKAYEVGERSIMFPTVCNLELLGLSSTVNQVFADAKRRKIEMVRPYLEDCDGVMVIKIPDHLGYPRTTFDAPAIVRE